MQFIRDIYAAQRPASRPIVSFEFFPPKTDEGDRNLFDKTIPALLPAKPDYCSVTYGAGGSTRDKTLMIVDRIQREHRLTALAHLTCVSHTREEVRALLEKIRALGGKNILALRGDPPGGGEFRPTPGGFEFSSQLVKFIRESGDFSVSVAGFPEGHIACKSGKHADWAHLKTKVDAGADFVITRRRPSSSRNSAAPGFRRRSAPNWTRWETTKRPRFNSASNTPLGSARSCYGRACRGYTFTR